MTKSTIGSLVNEIREKDQETRDPIELQRELQKNYLDELVTCVLKDRANYDGDFYVVVLTKRERLMQEVMRNYFFSRKSCPTPDYDQALYRYNAQAEEIEYIWCIPDRETCRIFKENALRIVPEEHELLQHVLDFADGTLYRLAKSLNNEEMDSPHTIKG